MTNSLIQLDTMTDINHQLMVANKDQYVLDFNTEWWQSILLVQVDDFALIREVRQALLSLGKAEQDEFWQQNEALKEPLQQLMDDSHAGEKLNELLQNLQQKIAGLRPPKSNRVSLKERFLLLFSWKQTAWQMWLENYHELKAEVLESVSLLDAEKRQLHRDGRMLSKQQANMTGQIKHLEHGFDLAQALEAHIKTHLSDEHEPARLNVISDEFLSAVQQRIIDLQQQLLIARQAVMTIELIIKQTEQQVHGIDQALQTTTATLDVTAALVLAKQGKQGSAQKQSAQTTSANVNQQLKVVQQSIAKTLEEVDGLRIKSKKTS